MTSAALLHAPGPRLTELSLSYTEVGDAGLAVLDRLPYLVGLGLGHTPDRRRRDRAIARLGELRTLVLSKVPASAATLAQLGALHRLERLYLDKTHADDAVVAALAPARDTLRVLHLASSDISDAGLPALRALDELTLGDTRVHDAIVAPSAWPRLRTLSLAGLVVTDQGAARARHPAVAGRAGPVGDRRPRSVAADRAAPAAHPRPCPDHLSRAGNAAVKRLAARCVEVIR